MVKYTFKKYKLFILKLSFIAIKAKDLTLICRRQSSLKLVKNSFLSSRLGVGKVFL